MTDLLLLVFWLMLIGVFVIADFALQLVAAIGVATGRALKCVTNTSDRE